MIVLILWRMKRKVEEIVGDEEKKDGPSSSTPPRPVSVGGVITSPGIGSKFKRRSKI